MFAKFIGRKSVIEQINEIEDITGIVHIRPMSSRDKKKVLRKLVKRKEQDETRKETWLTGENKSKLQVIEINEVHRNLQGIHKSSQR